MKALHAVDSLASLGVARGEVYFFSSEKPDRCIYRIDQAASRGGWVYWPELSRASFRHTSFRIHFRDVDREVVIAALEKIPTTA